jgi:predicted ATP-dependent endonuclease of OLD family
MSIKSIRIKNYKSLKDVTLDFEEKNKVFLLGENGSGKSNVISAIRHFFSVLGDKYSEYSAIDIQNPYTQYCQIGIVIDFSKLYKLGVNDVINKYKVIIDQYLNSDNELYIELRQYKDGLISWRPNNTKLHEVVKKIVPLYLVDTRHQELENWDYIWKIVTDLTITNIKVDRDDFFNEVDELLNNAFGEKFRKSISSVQNELARNNISINSYNFKPYFESLLSSRFGGRELLHDGYGLNYYSDGKNTFNILTLILRLIPALTKNNWKMPIILIDEIEVGLHPQMILELAEVITLSDTNNLNILITTHSPSLISELLSGEPKSIIYRMNMKKVHGYSDIKQLRNILAPNMRQLVTTYESSTYFAKAIVVVEGTTELHILKNRKINTLFSFLRKIDFYSYGSNNTKLEFVKPDIMNTSIPYKVIVDRDKILKLVNRDGKSFFNRKSDKVINPLSNEKVHEREKRYFYKIDENKKLRTYNTKQYIIKSLKKTEINLYSDKLYAVGSKINIINELINRYCSEYNIYPLNTTIEGLIINEKSVVVFWEWMKLSYDAKFIRNIEKILDYDKKWTDSNDYKYRSIVLRLIFSGKTETQQTLEERLKFKNTEEDEKELLKKISKFKLGDKCKTNGWAFKFIDYFFEKRVEMLNDKDALKVFGKHFPEMTNMLNDIKNMI